MMTLYDEKIAGALTSKMNTEAAGYTPTRMVTYDIESLVAYLNYIKANGADRVHVRFAAIEGDGTNGHVAGQPYQTILFYGNTPTDKDKTGLMVSNPFFDHGELCPQVCN